MRCHRYEVELHMHAVGRRAWLFSLVELRSRVQPGHRAESFERAVVCRTSFARTNERFVERVAHGGTQNREGAGFGKQLSCTVVGPVDDGVHLGVDALRGVPGQSGTLVHAAPEKHLLIVRGGCWP